MTVLITNKVDSRYRPNEARPNAGNLHKLTTYILGGKIVIVRYIRRKCHLDDQRQRSHIISSPCATVWAVKMSNATKERSSFLYLRYTLILFLIPFFSLCFVGQDYFSLDLSRLQIKSRAVSNKDVTLIAKLAKHYREFGCPNPYFKSVRQLSRDPQMILIEEFITPSEASALVQIAYANLIFVLTHRSPLFYESTVGADKSHLPESRRSQSAYLKAPAKINRSDEDSIVHCIEKRASEFQGHVPIDNMETLQVVKYIIYSP